MPTDPTPLAQRLRDMAAALIHEAAIAARPGQMDRLEDMAQDLRAGADQLAEHVAQTRRVYDLFAALLLGGFRSRRLVNPLDAVEVITEGAVAEVRDKLQVEINRDLVGNYVLEIVRRHTAADPIDKGDT